MTKISLIILFFGLSQARDNIVIENSIDLESLCDLASSTDLRTKYPGSWKCDSTHKVNRVIACSWYGVGCSSNGSIISLSLNNIGIQGTIPYSMGNLTSLQRLSFGRNTLSGIIPSSIGFLKKLRVLVLSYNKFSGVIPTSIWSIWSLSWLNLGSNSLISSISTNLGHLTMLEYLCFCSNQLSGVIPTSIGYLTLLKALGLHINKLSSSIPTTIGYLINLSVLDLATNKLSGVIPTSIGSLQQLIVLGLGSNRLTSFIPTSIGSLTQLSNLNFGFNKLSGMILTSIGNLVFLTHLTLYYNNLSGLIPTNFINLKNLEIFELSYNKIQGRFPTWIGSLSSLTSLGLRGNKLISSIPTSIGYLTNMWNLVLSYNELSGVIPTSIGYLKLLTCLSLRGNGMTSSIPTSIVKLTLLRIVGLSQQQLTGVIPTSIGNLHLLFYLGLGYNKLTSSIPVSIGELTMLEILGLSVNKLTGVIPTSMGSLTTMTYLGLQSNALHGVIPTVFGMLTNLITLGLARNQLSSSIPTILGRMKSLSLLGLANNLLSSSVPSELAFLTQLYLLSLVNNKLTGVFPLELCASKLGYIALKGNPMTCVPWCQDDYDWLSVVSSSPRCQDDQDKALFDMFTDLGISESLQTLSNFFASSRTIHSSHPFPSFSTNYSLLVNDYDAFEYLVEMSVFQMWGYLLFCLDQACNDVVGKYGGTSGTKNWMFKSGNGWISPSSPSSSLSIKNSSFYIHFEFDIMTCAYANGAYTCPMSFGFKLVLTTRLLERGWSFLPSPPYLLKNPSPTPVSAYAADVCQPAWYGITCEKGLVTGLKLSGLGLQGTLSTSIGLLTGLTSLDLSANLLFGSIVTSIGLLSKLNLLNFNQNSFEGKLPTGMIHLTSVSVAAFANNKLSGSVPTVLQSVTSMQYLYFDDNRFVGEIPEQLCESISERDVVVSLTSNTQLTCYQDECVNDVGNRLKLDTLMSRCVPTASPSTTPTFIPSTVPTPQPVRSDIITQQLLTTEQLVAVVACVFIFILVTTAAIVYRNFFSARAILKQEKRRRLNALPIHRTLVNLKHETECELLSIIDVNISTASERDGDGRTALEIILFDMKRVPQTVVHKLLMECLPFDISTKEIVDDSNRFSGWTHAVQSDDEQVIHAVVRILHDHKEHISIFANARDDAGRKCVDIASKQCKDAMLRIMYLHERYEIKEGLPEHRSATSLVILAVDHGDESIMTELKELKSTALKFMRHRDQFQNEVETRRALSLDRSFVMPILRAYDDTDAAFRGDAILKGYTDYPFCIVMEAAHFSLKRVIDQQYIAGHAWHIIRSMMEQLASCLEYLHNERLIHGDLKPLNVLQTDLQLKLIDFDASVKVGEPMGRKYSSCYMPPEMVAMDLEGRLVIRAAKGNVENTVYEPLMADSSFDMWGLGCVMYLLCTGSTLFQGNVEDNVVDGSVLMDLYGWSDSLKESKLDGVTNRNARNLLSALLSKEPSMRPSASRVISHPFLTGSSASRLPGEKAAWDVFISYRVDSDEYHAEVLYDECKKAGLKVWMDSKCLQAGQNWMIEFTRALIGSSMVLCVLSRGAVNHRTKDNQNIEKLTRDSPCDNLMLEWRLALEAMRRGMVETIFPVMVGDMDTNAVYSNYMRSDCGPTAVPDVVVASLESSLRDCLQREGLGQPFESNLTAKAIHDAVMLNQGRFVEGDLHSCVSSIASVIREMKARAIEKGLQKYRSNMRFDKSFSTTQARLQGKVAQKLQDEVKTLKLENERLRLGFST